VCFCMPTVRQNHRYAEMAVVLLAVCLDIYSCMLLEMYHFRFLLSSSNVDENKFCVNSVPQEIP
jgi:hypothetical protein